MAFQALKRVFAGKWLADINPFFVEKYKRLRKDEGRSEVTVNRELAFLKNLFTMAIKWGKASENPVKQVRLFREDNGRTRFLTEDEETRLLAHRGPYLRPIVITALHTGFRKSELLSLHWKHVDFRHRLVTVEAAYAKNGETRSIPMTALLTETLKASRIHSDPAAPVFLTREGMPYRDSSTAFATAVRKACIAASRFTTCGIPLPAVW